MKNARAKKPKHAIIPAIVAACTIALAGCSSASPITEGTYYTEGINNSGDLGQLVVDGTTLSHHEYSCEGVNDRPSVTSSGELNESGDQAVWTSSGNDMRNQRTGTEVVTQSESSISVGGDVYVRENTEEGKALLEKFQSECGTAAAAEEQDAESIPDGEYYSVAQAGGVLVELSVKDSRATFREVSCENSDKDLRVTSLAGSLTGGELMWDDSSIASSALAMEGEEVRVQDGYFEPEEYAPADDPRVAAGLKEFEKNCGAKFPQS